MPVAYYCNTQDLAFGVRWVTRTRKRSRCSAQVKFISTLVGTMIVMVAPSQALAGQWQLQVAAGDSGPEARSGAEFIPGSFQVHSRRLQTRRPGRGDAPFKLT
jgi:hypothetical protein